MLEKNKKNKIIIVGENFKEADYIVSNSYFVSNPKTTKRYKLPNYFKFQQEIKKGNIVINKIFYNTK